MRTLLVALLLLVPAARAADPPRDRSGFEVFRSAERHFARGEYREALSEYFEWQPFVDCGVGAKQHFDYREHQIVLCCAHLKQHDRAAGHLLAFAEHRALPDELNVLLVQLYREAKQVGDLCNILDELERRELVRNQLKWWLLTDEPRKARAAKHHTRAVRNLLDPLALPNVPAYPAALPLPKPGSLPKALP